MTAVCLRVFTGSFLARRLPSRLSPAPWTQAAGPECGPRLTSLAVLKSPGDRPQHPCQCQLSWSALRARHPCPVPVGFTQGLLGCAPAPGAVEAAVTTQARGPADSSLHFLAPAGSGPCLAVAWCLPAGSGPCLALTLLSPAPSPDSGPVELFGCRYTAPSVRHGHGYSCR